jgi:hypothetical protein
MAGSETEKGARSPKREREPSADIGEPSNDIEAPPENVEDVLHYLRIYLSLVSRRPEKDSDTIRKFVAGYRSPQPMSGPKEETLAMLKNKLMPNKSRPSSTEGTVVRPGPSAKLAELLDSVVDDPEKWLSTPSVQFGGRKPGDLIGTAEEPKIFDLLHAVDQGLF